MYGSRWRARRTLSIGLDHHPWTLPSNLGLCVNAKEEYATVAADGVEYILAKALVETHFGRTRTSAPPVWAPTWWGWNTFPCSPLPQNVILDKKAFLVVADPYVTLTEGTGIVHIAPAFGEDDNRVCRQNGLPFVNLVDSHGQLYPAPPGPAPL